jgi:hypothetical protein
VPSRCPWPSACPQGTEQPRLAGSITLMVVAAALGATVVLGLAALLCFRDGGDGGGWPCSSSCYSAMEELKFEARKYLGEWS